jgi:uncharacterized membrane protein YhaH (DUF805 family)
MHWYTDVIRKYAVFSGRAARPEYWWFVLYNLIVALVINIVVGVIAGRSTGQVVSDLYSLAVCRPASASASAACTTPTAPAGGR